MPSWGWSHQGAAFEDVVRSLVLHDVNHLCHSLPLPRLPYHEGLQLSLAGIMVTVSRKQSSPQSCNLYKVPEAGFGENHPQMDETRLPLA